MALNSSGSPMLYNSHEPGLIRIILMLKSCVDDLLKSNVVNGQKIGWQEWFV